ncbi:MAG: UDP-N-acetylmuramoyl-L-alanine--D-glutamate ligase [Proteobacteria bacterium]|nr:UDP-N-acetylmuramoyl-L-alanine--D-glutamate ligase [Pseudomonadota bacterium]MBU2262915.1 UDP-N-acetylmuramoyl-L-alanine--D-glutamate ligase [Pseudomonadota bacterium]
MNLKGQKVVIIGIGKTGRATARFLAGRGARITITDEKPAAAWGEAKVELEALPAEMTFAPYGPEVLAGADLVIPSPGVYPANPILAEALRREIPVLSEIELAWRFLKTPLVAVTGTNGKTTVTTLIGEMLRAAGIKAFVGGNIGTPLIDYVDGPQDADWAVVEVSSFQLQWVRDFHPRIAALLNVTFDHVDYHGSFAAYRQIKESIFARQRADDLAILNADEAPTASLRGRLTGRTEIFSSAVPVAGGMFVEGEKLIRLAPSGAREEYPLAMIRIPGRHNIENVMAALMAARACGCPPASLIGAVENFRGIAHRIEYAGEKNGVLYYDDSKGTNVGAVVRALESFSRPVVLLLGGRDKEGDFATLAPLIRERVREMVLFGEAREKINRLVGGVVRTTLAATMKEAVATARGLSLPGDVVLLSPGCASFDEFTDYKERGRVFKEMVGKP